jgi:outer membrane murein-binding lipoprotein Lpp
MFKMKSNPKFKFLSIPILVLTSLLLFNGCTNPQELKQLQEENAKLKSELEQLKSQQNTASQIAASPTPIVTDSPPPVATESVKQVAFEDIKGVFGEKEITQLAQLGVFETTAGKFNPQQPITRSEFVRWLVRANNAIWSDKPDKTIREAEGGQATFTDVPSTHPDFRYIQGVANAGIAVGYDETTFKPDQPLTREQMIAIKIGVDKGGIEDRILNPEKKETMDSVKPDELAPGVPDWTDRKQISPKFIPAFNSQYYTFEEVAGSGLSRREDKFKNVDRTFGTIKAFRPQNPVTRAEAAACISLIGNHTTEQSKIDARTAEQALKIRLNQGISNP